MKIIKQESIVHQNLVGFSLRRGKSMETDLWIPRLTMLIYVSLRNYTSYQLNRALTIERLTGYQKVVGSVPVRDSEIVFLSIGLDDHSSIEEYQSQAKYLYETYRVGHRSKIIIFNKVLLCF